MSLVLPVKLIAECPRTDSNGLGDIKKLKKNECVWISRNIQLPNRFSPSFIR
jgi:hypothetical protein